MPTSKSEVLQGTLDLIVLRMLKTMGQQHAYGIAPGALGGGIEKHVHRGTCKMNRRVLPQPDAVTV